MWLPPPTETNTQTDDNRAAEPENQTVPSGPTPDTETNKPAVADSLTGTFPQEFLKVLRFQHKWNLGTWLCVFLAVLIFPAILQGYGILAAISIVISIGTPGLLFSIPNQIYGSWAWAKKILAVPMAWIVITFVFFLMGTMPTPQEIRQARQDRLTPTSVDSTKAASPISADSATRSRDLVVDTTTQQQPTTNKTPEKTARSASMRTREDFITGLDRWQRVQAEGDPGEQVISISNQKDIVLPPGPFEDRRELLDAAIDAQQYLPVIKHLRQQRKISPAMLRWWQEKFLAGHVPLQMELAALFAKQEPKKAAICAVTAYIGAVLDAELCVDPSVMAAPRGLLSVYPQVQEILKQHAHIKAKLNAEAVKWHKNHPDRPSPQWIGYHGARTLSKGQVELLPHDQWATARARVLEKFQPATQP